MEPNGAFSIQGNQVDPRHIPGGTQRDIVFNRLPANPEELLHETLYPDDAYVDRVYWADLPTKEKSRWVNKQQNEEIAREFRLVWDIFKKDPLKPWFLYFRNYVITGLGFFVEGYVLFSVGNILTLFDVVWPECYKRFKICSETWVHTINYLEIVGIIVGKYPSCGA
jgi:DNA modification methylase